MIVEFKKKLKEHINKAYGNLTLFSQSIPNPNYCIVSIQTADLQNTAEL